MPSLTESQWDQFLSQHPAAHILQTTEWGQFKQIYGWRPLRLSDGQAGTQVLFRHLPLGFTIAYIPKGPLGTDWTGLLEEVEQHCKQERAIALYIEPDFWEEQHGDFIHWLAGFQPAGVSIQPRRTLVMSLRGTNQDWLERMKQKTRYNIRLAEKKGIKVEKTKDLDTFNALMRATGERDAFGIHQDDYYRAVFEYFYPKQACELFLASFEGQPLAAIMVFRRGKRAWYFYGASNELERNRMPTYLLQWEAMCWAAQNGCEEYDLWGVPDASEDELEEQFSKRSDGLWGVYRFKRGFGGSLKRSAGVYVKVLQPAVYQIYLAALRLRKQSLA